MSRQTRPYLPGAAFHITARIHRKEPWFDDVVRDEILRLIPDAVAGADARLLAHAIMPNHLHLVIRQGRDPLSRLLQPLLRRVAHRVHVAQQLEGYVFERRFRAHACGNPDYVRNAIVYTHLNPVRAGLCEDAACYRWSSHAFYCSHATADSTVSWLAIDDAIRLFARAPTSSLADCAANYGNYLRWRVAADRHDSLCVADPPPTPPLSFGGDAHWTRAFQADTEAAERPSRPRHRPDLRDVALATLLRLSPQTSIEDIRGGYGGRKAAILRREISRSAAAEGYRNRQIAEFLRISESRVSRLNGGVRRPY